MTFGRMTNTQNNTQLTGIQQKLFSNAILVRVIIPNDRLQNNTWPSVITMRGILTSVCQSAECLSGNANTLSDI
jgi:hypothetical protein